jgi:hypothetical protein
MAEPFNQQDLKPTTFQPDDKAGVLAFFDDLVVKR